MFPAANQLSEKAVIGDRIRFSPLKKRMRTKPVIRQTFALFIVAALSFAGTSVPSDLSDASLEDLLNVQVTSVSKKEQKLSGTPAAVFVISQDDIRRSGATNIPDVLRMAPGV